MSSLQDRCEDVLLGTAAGDALGAPWEFHEPLRPQEKVFFKPSHIRDGGPPRRPPARPDQLPADTGARP